MKKRPLGEIKKQETVYVKNPEKRVINALSKSLPFFNLQVTT